MQEFKDAKGFKEKAKVVAKHASRNTKELREEDRKAQEELLKASRENMNNLMNND